MGVAFAGQRAQLSGGQHAVDDLQAQVQVVQKGAVPVPDDMLDALGPVQAAGWQWRIRCGLFAGPGCSG